MTNLAFNLWKLILVDQGHSVQLWIEQQGQVNKVTIQPKSINNQPQEPPKRLHLNSTYLNTPTEAGLLTRWSPTFRMVVVWVGEKIVSSFSFSPWLASLLLAYGVVVYVHLFCISTVRTYHDDLKNSFIYLKKSFILMVVHGLLYILHLTTYHVIGLDPRFTDLRW